MIRLARCRSSSSSATRPASIVLPRPTSSASSRLTRGRLDGPGDRFELVRLDDHARTQRRLQRVHFGGGHRGPADRVEEGGQALGRVEAVLGDLRQRPSGQDAAAGLDLPDDREGLAVTAVLDALQGQQRASLTAGYRLLAYHPTLAADLHERPCLRNLILCDRHLRPNATFLVPTQPIAKSIF